MIMKRRYLRKINIEKKQLENDVNCKQKTMEKKHEIFSDCIALLNVEGMWRVVQT